METFDELILDVIVTIRRRCHKRPEKTAFVIT